MKLGLLVVTGLGVLGGVLASGEVAAEVQAYSGIAATGGLAPIFFILWHFDRRLGRLEASKEGGDK